MSEDASAVSAGRLYLDVLADTTGLSDDLKAKLEVISNELRMEIQAAVAVNADKARAELAELTHDQTVRIVADADTEEASADLDKAAKDRDVRLIAKADTAAARTDLDTAAKDRTVTVKAKGDDTSIASMVSDIGEKLASISETGFDAAKFLDIAGLVGNIAGGFTAVVASASQAVGVVGALPGLLSAAAQGAATVVLGFSGIGAAVKDMSAVQGDATQSAYSMQQAQQSAADQVRTSAQALYSAQVNAIQSVVTAEHSLADAEYQEQQAQVNLTQARYDATQNLINMREALQGAQLDQAQAALNLQEAQLKYTETMQSGAALQTPYEIAQAKLSVQEAQFALEQSKTKTSQAAYAKQLADKRGVQGSQEVVQAKHAETDATFSTQQAEESLTKTRIDAANQLQNAEISYKEALQAAHYSLLGVSSDTTTLEQQMAKLSPAGQKFADWIEQTLVPQVRSMKKAIQQAFIPDVQTGAEAFLPALTVIRNGLVSTAGVMGQLAEKAGEFFGSASVRADITGVMKNNTLATANFGDAFLHIIDTFRQVIVASEPLVLSFSKMFDHLAKVVDAEAKAGRESGTMAGFFARAGNAATLLAKLIDGVFHSLAHIFHAAAPTGTNLLTELLKSVDGFSKMSGSKAGQAKMSSFFEGTAPVLKQVADALVKVVQLFINLTKNLGGGQYTVLFDVFDDLLDVLNKLVKIPGLGPIINWVLALSAAGLGIGKVASNLNNMVTGLTNLTKIPGLSKLLSATGLTGMLAKLKEPGGFSKALSGVGAKAKSLWGSAPTQIEAPGADRVFSVGSTGEATVNDVDSLTGEGEIAGSGLVGLLSSGGSKIASGATSAMEALGGAASAAGGAIASAFSGAVRWIGNLASGISLASIKTAIYAAGTKLAALGTTIWEGATDALGVAMDFLAANPIILIIAAIAAVVAGVIYAYTHFAWFRNGVQDCIHAIEVACLWLWHNVFDPMVQGIEAASKTLVSFLDQYFVDPFVQGLKGIETAALWLWHNVLDPMYDGIKQGASDLISGLTPIWGQLTGLFQNPVKFVVNTVYDDGIAKLWNLVAGFVHLPKLPILHMAAGGIVPGHGRGDKIPALLEPNERILSLDQVGWFGGGDVRDGHTVLDSLVGRGTGGADGRYQGGGIINWFTSAAGDIGDLLEKGATDLLGAGKFIASAITDPLGTVKKLLAVPLKELDKLDKTEVGHLVAGIPRTIVTDIGRLVGSTVSSLVGSKSTGVASGSVGPVNTSGSLVSWIKQAIQLTGVSPNWLNPLEVIIQNESSDNPMAINLTDSNWQAGDPSRGLMQTIMTTFLAYHQKGTSSNIYDPVANIAAGINYILGRYSSIWNVPGIIAVEGGRPYVGYDTGGPVAPGKNWLLNSTGRDEWMLTPNAVDLLGGPGAVNALNLSARLYKASSQPVAAVASARAKAGGGATINIYPQPRQSEEEIGAAAARKLGTMLAG